MKRRPTWVMRRVRQMLNRLGPEWSDADVAEEVGVDKSRLSRWLNPQCSSTPSPEQLVRLCAIAGDASPIRAMLRAAEDDGSEVTVDALLEARQAMHAAMEVLDGVCEAQSPTSPGGAKVLPSEAAKVRPSVEVAMEVLQRLLRFVERCEDGEA